MTDENIYFSLYYRLRFIAYFIFRAFLISVFVSFCLLGIVIVCYFADLLFHIKKGDSTIPLFNAYVIVSQSMVPTIKINDAIVIKRMDNDNYNIGDIITFSSSDVNYKGLAVTHRIVDKKSYGYNESVYKTKGDNNVIVDPAVVKTEDIYGRVLFKIPKFGYIQTFFSKPSNFFFVLLIPTFVVLFYDIFRIIFMLFKKV